MKEEVGKKFDDAKVRLQENVRTFKQDLETMHNNNNNDNNPSKNNINNDSNNDSANDTNNSGPVKNNNSNNISNNDKKNYIDNTSNSSNSISISGSGRFIPKISLFGSNTSSDLLDEEVVDKTLRGDICISNDTYYENDYSDITSSSTCSDSQAVFADSNGDVIINDGNEKKIKKEILSADDICFNIVPQAKDIAEYCVPLLQVRFRGQTNSETRVSLFTFFNIDFVSCKLI